MQKLRFEDPQLQQAYQQRFAECLQRQRYITRFYVKVPSDQACAKAAKAYVEAMQRCKQRS